SFPAVHTPSSACRDTPQTLRTLGPIVRKKDDEPPERPEKKAQQKAGDRILTGSADGPANDPANKQKRQPGRT
ncbi:MAG: hypothetical protein V3T72_17915, partial [Thermoanaerobaculia bacterium]